MHKQTSRNHIKSILLVVLSAFLGALSIKVFIENGNLFPGGFAGISVLAQRLSLRYYNISIPFGLLYLGLNIYPTILVYRYVGKWFTRYSVLQIGLVSVFVELIPKIAITNDILLIAVFGGIFSGVAASLSLMANASGGGTDFIALFISHKTNTESWNYILAGNAVVLTIAGFLFGWEIALYSIIFQFVAIVGPSGSGKSTLMNIIGCLDVISDGYYELNGIPIKDYDQDELADIRNKQIGFVFQQFNLLTNLSALENVMMPMTYARMHKKQREEKALHLLGLVGLSDRTHHKPTELSGGQQQRVSIARALANDPAIILADEPTGALDTKTGQEVLNALKELNQQGKTVVIITHDVEVAKNTNRIITLRDGLVLTDVSEVKS